ncbi:prephenate dehydrogenase/arogenate dehydrogenase family protein [Apilactobacillus sp. TMW 2.2459]|uniref:prephenate dehydrogenase n=1 Tax=Apilactobacillus xinyiensis TaxID=2841032 RepID=UPI00200CD62C|nr:prephenate dehydrogenase/arogenate dehydrogenase family protein [Apilactobacillus xinyiensis]MCL0312296.1 prephenate dehydrogenase/arogenate dehydrogenase family protein [Apilactobacillus xinyiensis]
MQVFINGLGLIGGSIAKIMQQSTVNTTITGFDVNAQNIDILHQAGVITPVKSFAQGAQNADVIVLSASVNVIKQNLVTLATLPLRSNVLVTDVGSSKVSIMQTVKELKNLNFNFLGGHPMAGSHLSGSEHSKVDLFQHHQYFLVNENATDGQVNRFKQLMQPAMVNFQSLKANQHDELVSLVSHLPHALVFNMMNSINNLAKAEAVDLSLAGGGLFDTTRIAMGNPQMWTDILLNNSTKLVNQISAYQKSLEHFKQAIENQDATQLIQEIKQANLARRRMEE